MARDPQNFAHSNLEELNFPEIVLNCIPEIVNKFKYLDFFLDLQNEGPLQSPTRQFTAPQLWHAELDFIKNFRVTFADYVCHIG